MSVAKISEITASSSKSFEDAVRKGIRKMSETVDNIESAWVKEQKVVVEDGALKLNLSAPENARISSKKKPPLLTAD